MTNLMALAVVGCEAVGSLRVVACLVILGSSDYADAPKKDTWHGYASATVAAYIHRCSSICPTDRVRRCSAPMRANNPVSLIR
jgi:hypothetical protein